MAETDEKINIEEQKKSIKKVSAKRKNSTGILKPREKRSNTFKQSDRFSRSTKSIKWDNKSINEQNDNKNKNPINKEKLKESKSKFANSVESNNDDDVYMKGLNKVNQLNKNDDIIYKVIMSLSDKKLKMKKNNSCLTLGKHKIKSEMMEFYIATENEKIFDESLGKEQKLTLQNTLYNKIRTEIIDNDDD